MAELRSFAPMRARKLVALLVVALATSAGAAHAQNPSVPPGHPPLDPHGHDHEGHDHDHDHGHDHGDEGLPPGHPPTEGRPSPGPLSSIPQSGSLTDPELPAGTIVVEVLDGDGKPMPGADITLGILEQSVSKGESRRRVVAKADENGIARFDGLQTGSGISYRVSVPTTVPVEGKDPLLATHDAPPFQLDLQAGERVKLHVFPATASLQEALVGLRAMLYVEVKDDALQVEQAFTVFNLGKQTWVPDDVLVELPEGFRAFVAPQQMTGVGFDQVAGRGARLRGTFPPGQHDVSFRYQVPWDGSTKVALALRLPPHVAQMSIVSDAAQGMSLQASDFPPAQAAVAMNGQRILVTEKQLRPGDAQLDRLQITLDNLPGPGPGRWIALGLAALAIAGGLFAALRQKGQTSEARAELETDAARARERLFEELLALEKAKETGEVGPKTYEQVRGMLVDALAKLLPAR